MARWKNTAREAGLNFATWCREALDAAAERENGTPARRETSVAASAEAGPAKQRAARSAAAPKKQSAPGDLSQVKPDPKAGKR